MKEWSSRSGQSDACMSHTAMQASLKKQGQDIEDALHKNESKRPEKRQIIPKFMLRTDVRAMERAGSSNARNGEARGSESEVPQLSWKEQQV